MNDTLKELHANVEKNYHPDSIEEFAEYIHEWIQPILKKKKETHSRKIKKLIDSQIHESNRSSEEIYHSFSPSMKNLSNIEFNEEEHKLLNKAIKYNINLDYKPNIIEDELIELDVAIKRKPKEIQDSVRYSFIHEMNKSNYDFKQNKLKDKSIKEMKLVKSISNKLIENECMITKADKSNTVVIIKNEDYDQKVTEFIENNSFQELRKDPTIEYNKHINNAISKSKTLTNIDKSRLKTINPSAPILRGQPKIHKNNVPVRPVVNYQNAPAYKISKYLNNQIKECLPDEINYSVKIQKILYQNLKILKYQTMRYLCHLMLLTCILISQSKKR